ncbi:aquaporin [Streptomyces polygonati]|uniref:Aquaporin n=1 Tax=Streptomyces polygonati TaxID=1617087 RepID=A0ABV8HJZ0_9ACTN
MGTAVGPIIALLGPRSGGVANPARQFGPAVISGHTTDLWIYLFAPVLGAVLGASVHHLLIRRFNTHRPLTYELGGAGPRATDRQPGAGRSGDRRGFVLLDPAEQGNRLEGRKERRANASVAS